MNTIGKWDRPIELSNMDRALGPKDMSSILPMWEEIPEDFKANSGSGSGEARKWVQAVDDIFFSGVEGISIVMKNGINKSTAIRQMGCILHSYEPKHEHKTAGVAYLMSLWFEKFEYVKVKK